MASSASGEVTQNTLTGGSLLYTDTGSYGTVSSRVLSIFNYLGNQVAQYVMGSNLTQVFTLPTDDWFHFQCVVVDNTGTFTADVYFVATGYYWETYAEQFTSTNCGCNGNNRNLELSQLALNASLRFNLAGLPGAAAAHREITAANILVNQSAVVTI